MNKAILVIDMPKNCNECKIRFDDEYSNWCPYDNPEPNGVWKYVEKGTKPDWCPLKPLPEKEVNFGSPYFLYDEYGDGYTDGWNGCLNVILRD